MRTDVKIGLLCVFAVILGTVVYFVATAQNHPRRAQGSSDTSTVSATPGGGLSTPRTGATNTETPAASSSGLQVTTPAAPELHGMDLAPPSSGVVGQSLAQGPAPGSSMSGGMMAPPPSPNTPITGSQGMGLSSPATQPGGSSGMGGVPPLTGGTPISPGSGGSLLPSTQPSGGMMLGGSGGSSSLESPHREIPAPGGLGGGRGGLGLSETGRYGGGSGLGGSSGFGGSSNFGGPSLLGSGSSGSSSTHTIEKGDTFGSLAKKYGVTIKAITAANPGVSSNNLKIGKTVNIPAPSATPAASGSTNSMGSLGSGLGSSSSVKPNSAAATTKPSRRPSGTSAAAARPSTSTGTGKPGSTYTVKKGDTLGKIAESVYGDKAAWKKIYQANREQIADADVVTPGQVLKLP